MSLNREEKQKLEETLQVLEACKTEEEMHRAGFIMKDDEIQRKLEEINWNDLPLRIRQESDTVAKFYEKGTLPGLILPSGIEPVPCFICREQIEMGSSFRVKSMFIAHEDCLFKNGLVEKYL